MNDQSPAEIEAVRQVPLSESFWTWCHVAALSFGGPAAQIAVMHRIIVEQKKWISEERFLHALNYCMLLPGPEAQQLATYIGWLMHRTIGGLMAGVLFVLPGFVSILALSIVYSCYEDSSFVQALFFGLKPAVMAVVIEAVMRIGKRVLKNRTMVSLAIASFVAIFFFDLPFPLLIVSAGLIGLIGGKIAPDRFDVINLGHFCPLLLLGVSRCALHRTIKRKQAIELRTISDNRCCCWRRLEPGCLVFSSHAV